MSYQVQVRVCGGFPAVVDFDYDAEDPSVGWGEQYHVNEVCTPAGKPAPFIEKKMTKDDWDRVNVAMAEHIHTPEEY